MQLVVTILLPSSLYLYISRSNPSFTQLTTYTVPPRPLFFTSFFLPLFSACSPASGPSGAPHSVLAPSLTRLTVSHGGGRDVASEPTPVPLTLTLPPRLRTLSCMLLTEATVVMPLEGSGGLFWSTLGRACSSSSTGSVGGMGLYAGAPGNCRVLDCDASGGMEGWECGPCWYCCRCRYCRC